MAIIMLLIPLCTSCWVRPVFGRFCRELERSTNNKTVSILLVIILLVTLCLGYYVLYFRRRLVNRWNLEQVLEINKQVFTASVISASEDEEMLKREEDMLKDIPQQIADNASDAVNELLSIERLSIAWFITRLPIGWSTRLILWKE